ncbi:MAG: tetratricopeptide repeat protein, partial [Bacteroidales bacterium]|nr:tetratricopeptide repeat protein [Bacteroidales bacterium]
MKQILPILLVLLMLLGGCSTKRYVRQAEHLIDDGKLEDARDLIQLATDSAVNNQWAKTYLVYGKLAQTAATSKKKKDQDLFENPLQLAYKNYMKALDMDEKGKLDNSVSLLLPKLSNDFVAKGVKAFKARKYREAMISFEYVSIIAEHNIFKSSVDTGIIYNAGLAAYNAEIYEKAVEHFTICKEMNYGGVNLYLLLKNTYASMNDSANVLQILKEAFEKFPEEEEVLLQLVNYYIFAGMNSEALDFLKIAKEKNPDNGTYFFAEGLIYDRLGKVTNARNAYQKS